MSAANEPSPPGRMIDIGGRRLHLVCAGPQGDSPTVILEAGAFGFSADWGEVQRQLAEGGVRSCAYDRAGLGRSDPGPKPRDSLAIVRDLEALLARAGEPGPYIMVGHSMAGLHVRLFTVRNRDQVKGVVLVDATTADASHHPLVRRFVNTFDGVSQLAAGAASLGLFKPLAPFFGDKIGLPSGPAAEKRRAFGRAAHNRWAAEEVSHWLADADQAIEAGAYDPAMPVAIVTAGPPGATPEGWKKTQAAPALAADKNFVRNVDAASHADLLGQKHAHEIVEAILFVRQAAGA
ncbi:MAG TPA: alpha/beta fold hydrolase [Caulobacteraceae bacterium]